MVEDVLACKRITGMRHDPDLKALIETLDCTISFQSIETLANFAMNSGISPNAKAVHVLSRIDQHVAAHIWNEARSIENYLKANLQRLSVQKQWAFPFADGGLRSGKGYDENCKYKYERSATNICGDVILPGSFIDNEEADAKKIERRISNNYKLARSIARTANANKLLDWYTIIDRMSFDAIVNTVWALGDSELDAIRKGLSPNSEKERWLLGLNNIKNMRNLIAHHAAILKRTKTRIGERNLCLIQESVKDLEYVSGRRYLASLKESLGFLHGWFIDLVATGHEATSKTDMLTIANDGIGWLPSIDDVIKPLRSVFAFLLGMKKVEFDQRTIAALNSFVEESSP